MPENKPEKRPVKGEKKEAKKLPEQKARPKQIIRFAEADLDASISARKALTGVKGVSWALSNAISNIFGLGNKKLNEMNETELKKLEEAVSNPQSLNIPSWMVNRRFDPQTGENKHLIGSTLGFAKKMDISSMQKIRVYRGIRHGLGLPVRGQRTRSSFRKGGPAVGVVKKKEQPATAAKKE